MTEKHNRRLLAFALLLVALLSSLPIVDQEAKQQHADMFQRALVTFALARTLNGVISVVQGTEVALQPAGVGLTLTPGEILDPVNDLVERFSWVMLMATVSLGVQQVLLDVSDGWVVKLVVFAFCLLGVAVLLKRAEERPGSYRFVFRLVLMVLFVRFAVPLTLIANEWLYQVILEPRFQSSTEIITKAGNTLEDIAIQEPEAETESADDGNWLFGTVGRAVDGASKALDLRARVDRIREQAAVMVEHLIQLIVIFVLQTGVFPVLFLWALVRLGRWVFVLKTN